MVATYKKKLIINHHKKIPELMKQCLIEVFSYSFPTSCCSRTSGTNRREKNQNIFVNITSYKIEKHSEVTNITKKLEDFETIFRNCLQWDQKQVIRIWDLPGSLSGG